VRGGRRSAAWPPLRRPVLGPAPDPARGPPYRRAGPGIDRGV